MMNGGTGKPCGRRSVFRSLALGELHCKIGALGFAEKQSYGPHGTHPGGCAVRDSVGILKRPPKF